LDTVADTIANSLVVGTFPAVFDLTVSGTTVSISGISIVTLLDNANGAGKNLRK